MGRQTELTYFMDHLKTHHLAVISGMPGVGKTALAVTLAEIWLVWQMEAAQTAADDLVQDLAEKFAIDYGWDGDYIHFERPGVDGRIEVSEDVIHIQARLGMLLMFLHGRIENEIRNYLENHFDCVIED